MQDAADFGDEFGIALATMTAANHQFGFDAINVRAGVFDHAISTQGGISAALNRYDGMGFDAWRRRDRSEFEQPGVFRRHARNAVRRASEDFFRYFDILFAANQADKIVAGVGKLFGQLEEN